VNVFNTLNQRGFVSHCSDQKLADKLGEPIVLYAGFDPTAESLHIGNLLQIMVLAQFQRHGHTPIVLVGGATAMIGDPSGKNEERNLLNEQTIQQNLEGIKQQLRHFLDFEGVANRAIMVNNADWIGKFRFVDFLRDVGKHFRVGEMMGKESVRKRLQSEIGMSFTEFSYQLLQAYDFLYLSREHNCQLQVGGDDQWGNVVAGIDLTRKLDGRAVYGLTSPLITDSNGQKFGKTATGEKCWLAAEKTSPYEFYQYWIRSDDQDVIKLLKYFTFLPLEQIAKLEKTVQEQPEKREAQKVLAEEVTRLAHGEEQLALVQTASRFLFGEEIGGLGDRELVSIFANVPSTSLPLERLNHGLPILDAMCETGVCGSRGEAKKLIKSGGAYVNNIRVNAIDHTLTPDSRASESILVLRSGKKNYHLLRFE